MSTIGPDLPPVGRQANPPRTPSSGFALPAAAVRRPDAVTLGETVPPPEALDAVGVAADRAARMAGEDRELHFAVDESTGRVSVQLRRLSTGEVLGTIPAASALELLGGDA